MTWDDYQRQHRRDFAFLLYCIGILLAAVAAFVFACVAVAAQINLNGVNP